jgi:hypothetical protein
VQNAQKRKKKEKKNVVKFEESHVIAFSLSLLPALDFSKGDCEEVMLTGELCNVHHHCRCCSPLTSRNHTFLLKKKALL